MSTNSNRQPNAQGGVYSKMMRHLVLLSIIGSLAVQGFAQTPSPRPEFEVASIKLSKLNEGSDSEFTTGRVRMQGTLKSLIEIAYGISPDLIEGGPNWVDQEHYEIDAKAATAANTPELLLMLQTLLADRFMLQFHRETRNVSGYALVVTKDGIRMKEAMPSSSHTTRGSTGIITAENVTIGRLATRLARIVAAPVSDQTGNAGYFDFTLKWAPDKSTLSPEAAARESENPSPSIFTALQEQLGLRLEARKIPIELIVIDRAARPSLN